MKAKEAIKVAKDWIADIYLGEEISNIGLEEVKYDDRRHTWLVTVGFSRPWDHPGIVTALGGNDPRARRSYKIVRIKDGGEVMSVEDRVLASS